MESGKYRVVAVIMNGLSVNGFRILDENDKELNVKEDKLYDLVRQSKIEGVTIVEDEGTEYVTGLKLRTLEVAAGKQIKLESVVSDADGNAIGYKVAGSDKEISIKKAWNMGVYGGIQNGKSMLTISGSDDITKYFQCDEEVVR